MGISDLIPGISGGTIALITGIYDDFISSLNNLKIKNIRYILKSDFFLKLKEFMFDLLIMLLLYKLFNSKVASFWIVNPYSILISSFWLSAT